MASSAITETMVATISPSQLPALLSQPNAVLIDVRDHDEWATGHVDGARSVPLEQLRADPDRELPADATLVFICARGARSLTAAKLAERLGHPSVYNVDGGTLACTRAGLALISQRAAA
jgi:rhodanese-related sulfurtransferase